MANVKSCDDINNISKWIIVFYFKTDYLQCNRHYDQFVCVQNFKQYRSHNYLSR